MSWNPRFSQNEASLLTRCVTGDEAVVNRSPDLTMMGKLVRVGPRIRPTIMNGRLVYYVNGNAFTAYPGDGVVWLVEALGYPFFLQQTSHSSKSAFYRMAPCRDAFLRPLRMLDGTDQTLLKVGPAPISRRVPGE